MDAWSVSSTPPSERLEAALGRLEALVDWEHRERASGGRAVMRVDVAPARDLVERLGSPERRFHAVHVAGSKGKGSVASLIAAGLARMGFSTGLYTSPHVERVHERISIRGRPIEDEILAKALEAALGAREAAIAAHTAARDSTWFDVVTAAALHAFAREPLEWAVIECGLGGRLDSTNVLPASPAVLTNVHLEHTAILGRTRPAIAFEKAGIVKPGVLVVSGVGERGDEAADVVERVVRERGATLVRIPRRAGESIESTNVRLAGAMLDELGRAGLALRDGHAASGALLDPQTRCNARLPGRLEVFAERSPPIVLDGAHVPESVARVLADLARDERLPGAPTVVLGMGRDKDAAGILKALLGRADRVICTSLGPGPYRPPRELRVEAEAAGLSAEEAAEPADALERALVRAGGGGWVLVTGSLHLVGALRARVRTRAESPACSRSSRTSS